DMEARLPEGGVITGDLRIENWLSKPVAPSSPTAKAAESTVNTTAKSLGAKAPATKLPQIQPTTHAHMDATLSKVPLRSILDITAEHYGDLGFDTAVSGPVKVDWGGSAEDVADTVEVGAELKLAPSGVRRKGAPSNVPINGA